MRDAVSQLVAAAAFAQYLLLFHFHSADHMGAQGQFHCLLQIVIAVTLVAHAAPGSLPAETRVEPGPVGEPRVHGRLAHRAGGRTRHRAMPQ
jgi:hypothetical protein